LISGIIYNILVLVFPSRHRFRYASQRCGLRLEMYSWRRAGITASLTLLTGSHVNHKVDFSIHRRVMTLTDRTYAKPSILYYLDDTPVITTILPRFTGDMSVLVYHLSNIGPSGRN